MHIPDLDYKAFAKKIAADKPGAQGRHHDVLLHSSEHAKLDYTAQPVLNEYVSHYIAIYDEESAAMQILPAHAVTLRSTLRSEAHEIREQNAARSFAKQREELGMEFGTKKAKKAIVSKTVNAISGQTGRGVESAILDSVKEAADTMPIKEEQHDALLATKPIPTPNMTARSVQEVYSLSQLITPQDMRLLAVKDWQDAVKTDQEVKCSSRFVAHRLQAIASGEDVQKLKALKYTLLLIEFHNALSTGKGMAKKVPQRELLTKKLSTFPDSLIDSTRRRFSEAGYVAMRIVLLDLY